MVAAQVQPSKHTIPATADKAHAVRSAGLFSESTLSEIRRALKALDLVSGEVYAEADPGIADRLLLRGRDRVVVALDAIMNDEQGFLSGTGDLSEWHEVDTGPISTLFSDALVTFLEFGGHRPPPSATELVLAQRSAIEGLVECAGQFDRRQRSSALTQKMTELRQALDVLPAIPRSAWPRLLLKSKKVLAASLVGAFAFTGLVAQGVAEDVVKDVVAHSTLETLIREDDSQPQPSAEAEHQTSTEQELRAAILRAQLRKAEAEAAIAEAAVRRSREQADALVKKPSTSTPEPAPQTLH